MNRFKSILYVVDEADNSDALDAAVELALHNEAKLRLLCVVEPLPRIVSAALPASTRQLIAKNAETVLNSAAARASKRISVETQLTTGTAYLRIIQEVLRHGCDLVIKQRQLPGAAIDALLGSTDKKLLRKCPCPLWLIKPDTVSEKRAIMACVDMPVEADYGQDENAQINQTVMELATSLASIYQVHCNIVHAWEVAGENILRSSRTGLSESELRECVDAERIERNAWINSFLEDFAAQSGSSESEAVDIKTHLIKGPAQSVIPTLAQELTVGTVVIGTVARSGIPGLLLGNTAEGLLRQLDCSILAIKPLAFISPITLDI